MAEKADLKPPYSRLAKGKRKRNPALPEASGAKACYMQHACVCIFTVRFFVGGEPSLCSVHSLSSRMRLQQKSNRSRRSRSQRTGGWEVQGFDVGAFGGFLPLKHLWAEEGYLEDLGLGESFKGVFFCHDFSGVFPWIF